MTAAGGKWDDPFRTAAGPHDVAPPGARHALVADANGAGDGDLWRGPSEDLWIARLLHGAPPPARSRPVVALGARPKSDQSKG